MFATKHQLSASSTMHEEAPVSDFSFFSTPQIYFQLLVLLLLLLLALLFDDVATVGGDEATLQSAASDRPRSWAGL